MATTPGPAGGGSVPRAPLRRPAGGRLVAGVCAGLGERLGIDPLLVRVGFVAAATTGVGVVAYALGWALMPADASGGPARRMRTGRAAVEVGLGTGLLVLSALLAMRSLGLWLSDAVAWPLVLVTAGGALLWRQSQTRAEAVADSPRATPERRPISLPDVSRTSVGIALVIAAAVVFLQVTGALGAARDVATGAIVVAVVLGVIFAPFLVRLARERVQQRERAEVSAHLHDSVLQTLALVQKQAGDPAQVAALARRQERELRAWLSGRTATTATTLVPALEAVAGEVEQMHGATVEVVASGDRPLGGARMEALVAAAREAMTNAARHGGGDVSVFVEARGDATTVFVRDRGPGFDPAAVPLDRRGIRESIAGRMERNGGRARIEAAPGGGTEVELSL